MAPGPARLAVSLLETIDEMDYLTAPDARRIALVALESGRLARAKDLLLQSHASVPGDDVTLRVLEHTAILSCDAY